MDKNDVLEKEIDLIQGCINRMAHNSFVVKGWTVSLVAVVLALLPEKFDVRLLSILGVIISVCFWYLDAYFLKMERLYRWKYEWVIEKRLDSDKFFYNLQPKNKHMWLDKRKEEGEPNLLKVMFSETLIPIYLPIILLCLFMLINSFTKWI